MLNDIIAGFCQTASNSRFGSPTNELHNSIQIVLASVEAASHLLNHQSLMYSNSDLYNSLLFWATFNKLKMAISEARAYLDVPLTDLDLWGTLWLRSPVVCFKSQLYLLPNQQWYSFQFVLTLPFLQSNLLFRISLP